MDSKIMEQRVSALEGKLSKLHKQFAQCVHRLSAPPVSDDFTEYKGGLFQKKLGGGYRHIILCPLCCASMSSSSAKTHFHCVGCGHEASFLGMTLDDVITVLNGRP